MAKRSPQAVRARFRWILALPVMAVLAVLSWFWYRAGQYGHVISAMLWFLALATVIPVFRTSDDVEEMEVSADEQGITFASPKRQRALFATFQVLVGLALASWGYLQLSGQLPWHHFSRRGSLLPPVLLLLGLFGVFQIAHGIYRLYGLRQPAFLRVDTAGVHVSHGPHSHRSLTWNDIEQIPVGKRLRSTSWYTPAVSVYPRSGRKISAPPSLGSSDNGFRLTNLLRFYWLNPNRRNELGDGDALHRLQTGEFEPGVQLGEL